MGLLKQPVERKLSALVGAQVTFENLSVSLLSASVDARGVTVAGCDAGTPVLTIKRVRAELTLAKALKKELVIKSLTIEGPVLSVVRRGDGGTNLPRRLTLGDVAGEPAAPGSAVDKDEEAADQAADDAPKAWKLEARKVLLVDGEAHFRDESGPNAGYHLSAGKIIAEVKDAGGSGLEFTCIIDSVGRRDGPAPAELGPVKLAGTAENVPDLSRWSAASVRASADVGQHLRADLRCPAVKPLSAHAQLGGAIDLSVVLPMLPPGSAAVTRLGDAARGRVEMSAKVSFGPDAGLRLEELVVRATDVSLKGSAADDDASRPC
jgi:hypothetical protein